MFKVCLVQMDIIYKNPTENRNKISNLINSAMDNKPDLIVFPETCTTGYSTGVFHSVDKYLETQDGETISLLKELAIKHNVCICTGSIPEKENEDNFNTVFFINRNGEIISKYRKMHLYSAMDEDKAFKHGSDMPVFDSEFGQLAMMTCYDIRFVELSRTYALNGAKAIIVVSNFPNPKVNHWRTLLQARAIENQMYIIACNRVGAAEDCTYFGHSLIIDPWGEIIAEGDDSECMVTGEVDFSKVKEVRNLIPMYEDRQPETYKKYQLK